MFDNYNKVQGAVLEATLRLISEKELQATSMALISKESGISTGNIYHYFDSKEAIINELYKGLVAFHSEQILKGFYSNEPMKARFQRIWRNFIQFGIDYSKGFQFIEQYSFSPYISDKVKKEALKGVWCGELAPLYAEATKQKLFIELDPKLMVQMHYGSMVYLLKSHFQGNTELTDDLIQTVIDTCWNSVSKQ